MIMIGNSLKSSQTKTGWGVFHPTTYVDGYMSSKAEIENAKSIANAVSYMLTLPAYGYAMTAKQGEAKKTFFRRWLFGEKNGETIDNILLSVAHVQKISEILDRNEESPYFKGRFNDRLLEILSIKEATNYLPIMSHKRNSYGDEQISELQGSIVDITEYIIERKKYIQDLKLFLLAMIKAYNKACRYIVRLDNLQKRGDPTMFIASEYGRIVHRTFADALLYGFHLSPLYSNNPLFLRYDEEIRDAFELAGVCENLKVSLERDSVEYIHSLEFIHSDEASSRTYLKDNLVVTSIDHELHTKLLDVNITEAYYPFLSMSDKESSIEIEDNAFALAAEYWEKTQSVAFDRELLGVYSDVVPKNSTLYDIINTTVLDLVDIRQLGELAVAQAKFLNYYLTLDLRRKDYITKMVFDALRAYSTSGDGTHTIFNPLTSDSYADVDLMEDLYFYHEKSFLSAITKFNLAIRNNMLELVSTQANGKERPIYHVENNEWLQAIPTITLPNGDETIRFDMGDSSVNENNRTVLNSDNTVIANVVSKYR